MSHHGFLRVAAAVPQLRISDCAYNVERILALMQQAETEQVAVLVFPELCLTGYTCADLFQQLPLQRAAVEALGQLIRRSEAVFSGLAVVGVPLGVDDQLFNCAALVHRGRILGVVPKSFIPNYKEFYEARWFAAAATARSREIVFDGVRIPFGTNFLFEASDIAGLVVGVEICEDLWVPMPPSSFQALHGATLLVNLSASNEVIGKASYRKQLVLNQSGRCLAAYVYASCGVWESTTDVVFGGHCLIAENGTLLAESRRFQHRETLLVADIDLDRLRYERLRTNSYSDAGLYSSVDRSFTRLSFSLQRPAPLTGGVRSEEGGSEEATSSDSLFTPHS
jgi:NAD+ synthase (glutamine-hydrolysing)